MYRCFAFAGRRSRVIVFVVVVVVVVVVCDFHVVIVVGPVCHVRRRSSAMPACTENANDDACGSDDVDEEVNDDDVLDLWHVRVYQRCSSRVLCSMQLASITIIVIIIIIIIIIINVINVFIIIFITTFPVVVVVRRAN